MKPVIIIPIVVGGLLLTAGAVALGIGIAKQGTKQKTETHEYVVDEFTNVNISVDITDVTFYATTDGTRKVVVEETEKLYHTVAVSEGTLDVQFTDARKWSEKILSTVDLKVNVYMPSGAYNELNVKLSTGDTVIPGDFTFNNISVTASTGKTTCSASTIENANFVASTGNVKLSSMSAKNINIKRSTGNIEMENVNVLDKITSNLETGSSSYKDVRSANFEHKSTTGKVTFTNTIVANHLNVKTSTGDVRFNDSDALTATVVTTTGDVKGTILTAHHFIVETDTGKKNYPKYTEGGLFEITTDTGDIDISIKA